MSFPSQNVYIEHLPAVVGANTFESLAVLSPVAPLSAQGSRNGRSAAYDPLREVACTGFEPWAVSSCAM